MNNARILALYLPQFHPIPENDEWWGTGFTEWTNVTKAKPLYPGHKQPKLPADLGFYDLRVPEVREQQADLARRYGVEAFMIYYYWFEGKRLLERPLDEMLASGKPDYPFCLCWANGSWTGIWHGTPGKVLQEQRYPGETDDLAHFDSVLLPAMADKRYLKVGGRSLLAVHAPQEIPHLRELSDRWREQALRRGLGELFLLGFASPHRWSPRDYGFDAGCSANLPPVRPWVSWRDPIRKIVSQVHARRGYPTIYRYEDVASEMLGLPLRKDYIPVVVPNWDNTPRSGPRGRVLENASPVAFRAQLERAVAAVRDRPLEERLVILKSWNEWAEGNYVEPDREFGHQWLESIYKVVVP